MAAHLGVGPRRRPGDQRPPGLVAHGIRLVWGSLLRRTGLIFVIAHLLTAPAIYVVYLDQERAYRTTLAAEQANAARGDIATMMLALADQQIAIDRYEEDADPTAAAGYAAYRQRLFDA